MYNHQRNMKTEKTFTNKIGGGGEEGGRVGFK